MFALILIFLGGEGRGAFGHSSHSTIVTVSYDVGINEGCDAFDGAHVG